MRKQGALGEGIIMIYRLILVSFIALVVLGLSAVFYSHYIDVRDAEAVIMSRNLVECLTPGGVLNLGLISKEQSNHILDYCGYENNERFYVILKVVNSSGDEVGRLSQGDSGSVWVKKLYEQSSGISNIKKYNPGFYENNYTAIIINDSNKFEGKIMLEVLINNE